MKRIRESTLVKIIIFALIIICNTVLAAGIFLYLDIKKQGVYDNDKSVLIEEHFEDMAYELLNGPATEYTKQKLGVDGEYEKSIKEYIEFFAPENNNFLIRAFNSSGKEILSTYEYQEYRLMVITHYIEKCKSPAKKTVVFSSNIERFTFNPYRPYDDGFIAESYKVEKNDDGLWEASIDGYYLIDKKTTISGYLKENFTAKDGFYEYEAYINELYRTKDAISYVIPGCLVLLIVLTIVLVRFAGHRSKQEGIYLGAFDRIPLDILVVILAAAPIIMFAVSDMLSSSYRDIAGYIFTVIFLCYAVCFIISLAARIKKGRWWKNTIIFRAARFFIKIAPSKIVKFLYNVISVITPWVKRVINIIARIFKAIIRWIKKVVGIVISVLKALINIIIRLIRKLPLFWKAGLAYFLIAAIELICILFTTGKPDILIIIWSAEKLLLIPAIILIVLNLNVLKKGGEQLANGNLEHKIDLKHMFWDLKKHGENLNSINIGMKHAVEEQMKSERLKTELITNVSHDIKTPLTSIVSYVDLLKREDVQPEAAKQYIEVLDRQSAKLKKLIDDLMEVSKASTGNIEVKLEELDVNVLLSQALGDYVEKLEKNRIKLITDYCSEPAIVSADGQLLWRVFDNLLNNICKYAQEGTRVYIDTRSLGDDEVKIIFKNISRFELNISADELMERFVRGDSSRSTEGSGLGLSIAENLMQLQGGKLNLFIDGDLFKAEVTLKSIAE